MNWVRSVLMCALAAGALLLAGGCADSKKVAIAAKDADIRSKQEQLVQAQADKDSLSAANKQLAEQNTLLAERNARIAAETQARLEQLAAQNAASDKALMEKIAALKLAGAENVTTDNNGAIRLKVAATVLFDPGKGELKSTAGSSLKNIASTIKSKFPDNYVRIEGHTDSTPVVHSKDKYADNMALSLARSRAVYDFLVKQGGLSAGKLYAAGYGDRQPLVHPEKTASDRAKNRRVEIVIMPKDVKVQKDQLAATTSKPVSTTKK